jgi:sigma-B regulation protein RsbU (phosphoserine phosphatase)
MTYGAPSEAVTVTSGLAASVATIAVHNQGEPIPSHLLASIFEPMVRGVAENSPARSVGLGLFIVQAIATAHAGQVTVVSTLQDGTTFEFSFPARRD